MRKLLVIVLGLTFGLFLVLTIEFLLKNHTQREEIVIQRNEHWIDPCQRVEQTTPLMTLEDAQKIIKITIGQGTEPDLERPEVYEGEANNKHINIQRFLVNFRWGYYHNAYECISEILKQHDITLSEEVAKHGWTLVGQRSKEDCLPRG